MMMVVVMMVAVMVMMLVMLLMIVVVMTMTTKVLMKTVMMMVMMMVMAMMVVVVMMMVVGWFLLPFFNILSSRISALGSTKQGIHEPVTSPSTAIRLQRLLRFVVCVTTFRMTFNVNWFNGRISFTEQRF